MKKFWFQFRLRFRFRFQSLFHFFNKKAGKNFRSNSALVLPQHRNFKTNFSRETFPLLPGRFRRTSSNPIKEHILYMRNSETKPWHIAKYLTYDSDKTACAKSTVQNTITMSLQRIKRMLEVHILTDTSHTHMDQQLVDSVTRDMTCLLQLSMADCIHAADTCLATY